MQDHLGVLRDRYAPMFANSASLISVLRLPLGLALARQLRLQVHWWAAEDSSRKWQERSKPLAWGQRLDRHFPLEQIVPAFRHQESGRHFGKIVLDI
jgi:NADPH:quinone reductase-like Zn-dependent oxidoreductase